ncbi:hypothetical protein BD779DRAFT_387412 [Infundibulicybe gibba]|nr:hypothetical protein BD779DRAFT_387412 [Infundibulicybe gibba]
MDNMDNPPPPAYTEQEFDRKVSNAMQVSLNTPQPPPRDEDGWEVWDESAFQAALTAISRRSHHEATHSWSTQPAGSSTAVPLPTGPQATPLPVKAPRSPTAVRPLQIHKKSASLAAANTPSKQRPSWLNEAEHSSSPHPPQPRSGPSSAAASSGHHASPAASNHYAPPVHHIPPEEDELHTIPPPPFSAEGPSLDGPDYEQVVTMTYHPPNTSRPPSPLTSPLSLPATLHPRDSPMQHQEYAQPYSQPTNHYQPEYQQPDHQPYRPPARQEPYSQPTNHYQHQYHQQSSPQPRQPQAHQENHQPTWNRGVPRPLPAVKPTKVPPPEAVVPQMDFNPSIAYSKRAHSSLSETPPPQQYIQGINANAFYNSAVSPHVHLPTPPRHQNNGRAQYLSSQPQQQQFKQHSALDQPKIWSSQHINPTIHQPHYPPTNVAYQPNFGGANMYTNSGHQPWSRPEDQYSLNLG